MSGYFAQFPRGRPVGPVLCTLLEELASRPGWEEGWGWGERLWRGSWPESLESCCVLFIIWLSLRMRLVGCTPFQSQPTRANTCEIESPLYI